MNNNPYGQTYVPDWSGALKHPDQSGTLNTKH